MLVSFQTCPQDQNIFFGFVIPQYKRISPVIRIISRLRNKGHCILRLCPVFQILTDRMHQYLRWFSLFWIISVVTGVECMIFSFSVFADTSGKDKLILLFIRSSRNRHTAILISHKILCGCQIPAKRLSKRARHSGISLMKQVKSITLSKRHTIAKPSLWMLIINFHAFPSLSCLLFYSLSVTDPEKLFAERNEFFGICLERV